MADKAKAIVLGVNIKEAKDDFEYSMDELKRLAEACDIEVVGEMTQKLDHINKAHYIGTGKLEELICLVDATEADMVIFNDELSPSQIRVLEEKLGRRVVDRTMLILDIFARRARTREAQLQVEVARLQYMLPRLVGSRQYLSRQVGGVGVSSRGLGETKLELDRRKIEDKIAFLRKELDTLVYQREIRRSKRRKSGIPVVSLVGYTNAGKSTIMNAMVDMFNPSPSKKVFERDMLFATLDTSVRRIKLPDNKTFLLTDTVGFINKLPHHLVKSFRSTLEEVVQADLIIHVVDYSDPKHEMHIEVTNKTLLEIGVKDIPIIYAFNKADLTETEFPRIKRDTVYLSARLRVGIAELIELIKQKVFNDYVRCEMLIPYEQGHLVSYFEENANVIKAIYEQNGTKLLMECRRSDYNRYKNYLIP